ncbi:MAG: DUF4340 domain-containing protein [Phycisphaerales bacterium]|nr:MAG: DUF4340 domain-containing protein [Phycisphaerales bacterium]
MNTKTTLLLAVLFLVLVVGYLLIGRMEATREPVEEPPLTGGPSSAAERILVEEDAVGDAVKIVCRRRGEAADWVFARDSATSDEWRMTSPFETEVAAWEVNKFNRQLLRADFEISYKPGEPGGVTPEQAGLDQPEAVVTMTDEEGKSVTIEIGKPASATESYVRLADSDEICVIALKLSTFLKQQVLEYRDLKLWTFDAQDTTRLEIVDRERGTEPVTYSFTRTGADWMMESPAGAKATDKVQQAVTTLSRLRASKWIAEGAESLGMYGLAEPVRTVRVTVVEAEEEEEEESAEESEEAKEEDVGPPELKETVYELHLSGQSPIGEDTSVYARIGDEAYVATISKFNADKLKPVMTDWRVMSVTTAQVRSASSIQVEGDSGTFTLIKKDGAWSFAEDGEAAEDSIVTNLLSTIADMNAAVFVDGIEEPGPEYGLDEPRALLTLTIPGSDEPERVAVGAYTDERLKRLVYVQRNESTSIAKVRATDVEGLLRGPRAYRNRTIFNLPAGRIGPVTLRRENRFGDGDITFTFERSDDTWRMTAPADAEVQTDLVEKLVEDLATLRATSIVEQGDALTVSGLDAPSATVTFTYKPPVTYRFEPAPQEEPTQADEDAETPEAGADEDSSEEAEGSSQPDETAAEDEGEPGAESEATESEPQKLVPVEVQPPDQTYELLVAQKGAKAYAKRSDQDRVCEVADSFADQLFKEFRPTQVHAFDEKAVVRFSIRYNEETYVFDKMEGEWQYAAEPDWPIDSKKVENLLLQVRDLRTERYVAYGVDDATPFALGQPEREVVIEFEDGTEYVLLVSSQTCPKDSARGRYAQIKGRAEVFLLSPASTDRFKVSLDELEAE